MLDHGRPIPIKTIFVTIWLVLGSLIGLYIAVTLAHIEALLVIAIFLAVVLNKPVDFFTRRFHLRRGLATTLVYLIGTGLFAAMLYAFINPLVNQVEHFANNFDTYVSDARAGKGPVGDLVKEYDLDKWFQENKDDIQNYLSSAGGGAIDVALSIASGAVALLTVLVLSFLMILYGPDLLNGGLAILSPPKRARVKAVAVDCARALTGYVLGNLLISIIAAFITFIGLLIFGVPFRGVLALWVGFADLIPLVGATLGAIPTIAVAFLHSPEAGIGMLILYIVYQQFENHVLQVAIMSKTVQINQLFVLVSVLIGVELFGFIGALLAIPAAGVIQVIGRDLWDNRAGQWKSEPTIGEDQVPVSEELAREAAEDGAVDGAGDDTENGAGGAPDLEETPEPAG
ncbi:MAG TPA: AI-2E family transporter [Acidimicrobiales bacterium]|jgi:predicted PurR-regulated permease PerM